MIAESKIQDDLKSRILSATLSFLSPFKITFFAWFSNDWNLAKYEFDSSKYTK